MRVEVVDEGVFARLSNLVVGLRLLTTRLEDPECTKIRQLLRHKGFALRLMICLSMSVYRRVKD
jgi:hypothetical protein